MGSAKVLRQGVSFQGSFWGSLRVVCILVAEGFYSRIESVPQGI